MAATLSEAGFGAVQVDLTVLAERPAIGPHRDRIRRNLAGAIGIGLDAVSVKATRPEGLGLTGDGSGCLAIAVVVALLDSIPGS